MSQATRRRRPHVSTSPGSEALLPFQSQANEGEPGLVTLYERTSVDGQECCVECRETERVYRRGQIKVGDHIELPRPQFFAKLLGLWMYAHHALIVGVQEDPDFPGDETKVRLTVIEKTGSRPYIRKSVQNYDFNDYYLLVHRYRQPTFSTTESVRRANRILTDYKQSDQGQLTNLDETMFPYNLLKGNCEHFVMWIKTGIHISSQVHDAAGVGVPVAGTILSKILNVVKVLLKFASNKMRSLIDDIGKVSNVSSVVSGSLIGFALIISAAIAVYDLYKHYKLYKNNKLCKCCFRRKVLKLLAQLSTGVVLVGIGAVASYFGGLWVAIGVFFVGSALSLILAKCFDKIYKLVLSFFPSRDIQKSKVNDLSTINPGDAITFMHRCLPHQGIVTATARDNVTVAHYACANLFASRVIVEQNITLDDEIRIHDYTDIATYPPEVVVRRARERLGESRFNTFTNRSSHFVAWCKRDRGSDSNRQASFAYLTGWQKVFSWDDVICGDVVQLWMYGRRHATILVEKHKNSKQIRIIHLGYRNSVLSQRMIKSDLVSMNLKVNYLYKRDYSHFTCFEPTEVVERAWDCFQTNRRFGNSKKFVLYCKVK